MKRWTYTLPIYCVLQGFPNCSYEHFPCDCKKNFLFATNTNLLKSSQCVTVDVSAALHKLCHNIRVLSFFICSIKILYWALLDGVFPFTYFTTLTAKGKKQAPNQTKSNQNQTELMQKLSLTTSSPFFLRSCTQKELYSWLDH